jgi:hypothetical protein
MVCHARIAAVAAHCAWHAMHGMQCMTWNASLDACCFAHLLATLLHQQSPALMHTIFLGNSHIAPGSRMHCPSTLIRYCLRTFVR